MTATKAARALPDTYFELVKELPLAHLRDDSELDAAQEMIDRLLVQDLDDGAQEYLNVLTDLVEAYENEHHPIPDASEADVLRALMQAHRFSQVRLAQQTGIAQSTLAAVLKETGSLTKEQVITLARFFHVSPAAFL